MKRKYVDTDSNEAEADVSEASRDQKKFDNRLDQMEGMIRGKFADIDGSIQKVQASLVEIHENIGMLVAEEERLNIKWNIEQGVVHATFNINDVPNISDGSISSKTTYCSGANWWLVVCKTKEGPSLGAYLHHTADLLNVYHGTNKNYTIRLLGSSGNKERSFLRHTPVTSRHCSWGIPRKDQDEIELKEVFAEEFLHLLKVIYPPFDDAM
uniref:MATH domain-containing protein n=1 Tax=Ditylenchus dipsaci TaxID=166011 RepID=A0A915DIH2_9BILA